MNGNGVPQSQIKRGRLKDLIILLLLGMLIAAAVIAIPAVQQRGGTHTIYVQRMQSECDEALRQTASLSRNAGADSAAILAKIRSNIYAIRLLNSLSTAQGDGALLDEDRILTLQNTVDRYLTYLTTGMDTGEYQTNLQIALEDLQAELNALK
jgi:hypothetical protein